jgi:uncharacterized Fe-S center protein
MDKVFFMNLRAAAGSSLEEKFGRLLKKAGIDGIAGKGALAAIKVHVGESGNLAYVNHNYARIAAAALKANGARPFLTDTNTLYSGSRHNAVDHCGTAALHGYAGATAGAPFIAADGLRGLDFEELPADGRRLKRARIGSALCQADALVMLSHFKGHCEMGFGGTIKNMGMGCAAVPGKLELHSGSRPKQNQEKCVACGQCVRQCPADAIVLKNRKAVVDYGTCIGCGQCVAACNYGAMNVRWDEHNEALIEKVAEYALAVQKRFDGKALYVNFALAVSPDCDCWDHNDAPVVQDAGIFASVNPLALDRAALDAINRAPRLAGSAIEGKKGDDVFGAVWPEVKSGYLFEYCRKLGMEDAYNLVKVDP